MSLNNKQHREMIAKYHQNKLSAKEMNSLERQALEDPFLSDALDGFEILDTPIPTQILNDRIANRTSTSSTKGFYRSFSGG